MGSPEDPSTPSNGLCSSLFHIPSEDSGCSEYNFVTYWALNLKKSINSHAASISWHLREDCHST